MDAKLAALVALVLSLFGCEADYRDTSFRCDTDRGGSRGCPEDQTCIHGRCRRGGAVGEVACGEGGTCAADQQCCLDGFNDPRCIPAGDACEGQAALCDGRADCAAGDFCCDGPTIACGESCADYTCLVDEDCPSDLPHCCAFFSVPWKSCAVSGC